MSVFGPLAKEYKRSLEEYCRFSIINIDKMDFLSMYQTSKIKSVIKINILKAWKSTGLISFNPDMVMHKLQVSSIETSIESSSDSPKLMKSDSSKTTVTTITVTIITTTTIIITIKDSHSTTSSKIVMTAANESPLFTEATFANVQQVDNIVRQMRNLDFEKSVAILDKLVKEARYALAESTLLRTTNDQLLAANCRKKERVNRSGTTYGQARVMRAEDLKKRQQWVIDKQEEVDKKKEARKDKRQELEFNRVVKELSRLGPDLIGTDVLFSSKAKTQFMGSPLKSSSKSPLKSKWPFEGVSSSRPSSFRPVERLIKSPIQLSPVLEDPPSSRFSSRGRLLRSQRVWEA